VKKFLATTALTAALVGQAQAATITFEKDGCNPKDCYKITIDGKIEQDDFLKFEKIVKANDIKLAAVFLNSPGGNLISGVIMGLMIHKLGFYTVVDYEDYCVSVCASIWIAGAKRYVVSNAKIGFHQPYFKDGRGHIHKDPKAVAMMKDYYAKVGVPKPAADFFVAADPKDVYWMNSDLAAGFKIDTIEIEAKKEEPPPPKVEEKSLSLPKTFLDRLTSGKPL
jgi:hypothetical protein